MTDVRWARNVRNFALDNSTLLCTTDCNSNPVLTIESIVDWFNRNLIEVMDD